MHTAGHGDSSTGAGLTAVAVAQLVSAFYYGYTPLQSFAGSLAQMHGGGGSIIVCAAGEFTCITAVPRAPALGPCYRQA